MERVVVMVEDDEDIVAMAHETIPDLLVFTDAPSAIAALDELAPLYVVLDLDLPGINGYEVLKAVRAHATHHRVPVVIFSGKDISTTQGYQLGANAWVRKPSDGDGAEMALEAIHAFWSKMNQSPE